VPDAGAPAVAAVVDAGAPVVDAGAPVVVEQKKTFDWYLAQGDRLREREKPEQALDFYGKASDLKPERVEPITGRGLALLDMANPSAAAATFESALKMNSRYGPAIMGLAEAYRIEGKNEKAIEYYQRYLDVLPNGAEAAVARNSIERLKK
jgi:tetratricopeptide (TPR) repeat protein